MKTYILCILLLLIMTSFGRNRRTLPESNWQQHLHLDTIPLSSSPDGGAGGILYIDNQVSWWVGGQCYMTMTPRIDKENLFLTWNGEMDCNLNVHPDRKMNGKLFAKLSRINDTTVAVQYFFPSWINVHNQKFKDEGLIFGNKLYVQQPQESIIPGFDLEYEAYRDSMKAKYGDTLNDPRYWYGYEPLSFKFPYDDSTKRIEILKHLNDSL